MNPNKNLFYYGMFATLKEMFGVIVFVYCLFFALFLYAISSDSIIMISSSIGGLVLGGYFTITGRAQRFDYQMQSGTIVHGGDGW